MVHKNITGNGVYVFRDLSSSSRICAVVLEDEESLRLSRAVDAWGAGGGTGHPVLTSPIPVGESLVSSGDGLPKSGGFDWKETPKCHVFKGDVPGFKRNEVEVAVKPIESGALLQIRGKRRGGGEKDGENDKWHLMERGGGGGVKFSRRFELPEGAVLDQVRFDMEDGVLTVVVPKEEAKMVIEVEQIGVAMKGKMKID